MPACGHQIICNMDIAIGYLLKALLLPPCGNLLLGFAAWKSRRRWPRGARALLWLSFGSLFALTIPLVSTMLAAPLEDIPALNLAEGVQGAEAIVVLGGGRYDHAPEYDGRDTVHPRTLERLRYGVYLHRALGLPLALVGGTVAGDAAAEGMLMFDTVNEAFKVPVQWIETGSRNTAENAEYTRYLVNVKRIVLVTHALHMRRAMMMYQARGFEVVPAPLGYRATFDPSEMTVFDFVPSVEALALSSAALHEYIGNLWYRIHYL